MSVASGVAAANLPGRILPDREYGGSEIATEISSASPVIAQFRQSGFLRITALRESVDAPPVPKGMRRAFLKFCG